MAKQESGMTKSGDMMNLNLLEIFDNLYRKWADEASRLAGYETVVPPYKDRIPEDCRIWVARGIQEGLCKQVEGMAKFNITTEPERRIFSWFSNWRTEKKIGPNWEMFIHVAGFSELALRYKVPFKNLRFEYDGNLIDIAILKDSKMLAMVEIKEYKEKAEKLVSSLNDSFISGVSMDAPDRYNDVLRKAKYIINHRPELFVTYSKDGIGGVFRIEYIGNKRFQFQKVELIVLNKIVESLNSKKSKTKVS